MRPGLAVLLTLIVLLAGCSKPSDEHPPTSASGVAIGWTPWGVSPQTVDCNMTVVNIEYVFYEAVQAKLPPGYETGGLVPGVDGLVNLELGRCQSIVIDNATVIHDVGIAMVVALVLPPADTDVAGDVDVFVLEYVTDNEIWESLLSRHGLGVLRGSVQSGVNAEPSFVSTVTAPGLMYTATEYGAEEWYPSTRLERRHHYASEQGVAWFYANSTAHRETNRPRAVDVVAEGGFLGDETVGGHTPAHAMKFERSSSLEFGRTWNS